MKEELKLMLVLQPTKIVKNPLDLFSTSDADNGYCDFEYYPNLSEDAKILSDFTMVDGYEVNIFEPVPSWVKTDRISGFLPRFIVDKKFLSKSFIGYRKPGDVGILTTIIGKGSITTESKFSEETMNDFFPSIFAFYKNLKNGKFNDKDIKYPLDVEGLDKLIELLIKTNRDIKINNFL